jgi:hypothetical protein
VEREPIYRQHETVSTFAEEAFGLEPQLVSCVSRKLVAAGQPNACVLRYIAQLWVSGYWLQVWAEAE